jgi:mRNA interferase RelE/StbE
VASYSVEIKPSARKELEALPDHALARVFRKIEALAGQPRPVGSKKLTNYKDHWRIRIGDWRVVYIIDDSNHLVTITRVRHRKDVYG